MTRAQLIGILPEKETAPVLIEEDQNIDDIIYLLSFAHKKNADNYDLISEKFWAGSVYETCKNLFYFLKNKIAYDIESEDMQSVCSPRRILQKARGDCKHYASFINGVLSSLERKGYGKINNVYRFASYKMWDEIPTHVFAVVKSPAGEIWIDPVLEGFDEHRPFTYSQDRKIRNEPAAAVGALYQPCNICRVDSCPCRNKQIGIAPLIIYAVAQLIPLAIKAFGNNYTQQSSVRWLIQLYQQFVLGQTGVTASNANQSLANVSMQWFSNQLGVPVLDRTMFDELKGYADPADEGLHNQTYEQRANNYLTHTGTTGVTFDQALNAAKLTDLYLYHMPPGSWKNIPPASQISPASIPGAAPGEAGIFPAGLLSSPLILIGAGIFVIYTIMNPPRAIPRRKR